MSFVCGYAQAILSKLNFWLNDSTSASDSEGADPFADWDADELDHHAISEGVRWSGQKGTYAAALDCSQSEIPRLCLLNHQLDAIHRRQRLDDVLEMIITETHLRQGTDGNLENPLKVTYPVNGKTFEKLSP